LLKNKRTGSCKIFAYILTRDYNNLKILKMEIKSWKLIRKSPLEIGFASINKYILKETV